MIAPIGAVGATATAAASGIGPAQAATTAATAPTGVGAGFGQLLTNGLEQVSQMEFAADAAIQDLATGGPTRIEDVMIATSQAQVGIEMLSRVRDRALEAYQEIMRMPL